MAGKLKNFANKEERIRAGVLINGVCSSLFSIVGLSVKKREKIAEENEKLRKLAIKNGIDLKSLKPCSSPLIHAVGTLSQYLRHSKQFARWLAKHHPDVNKIEYAYKQGYAREFIQSMIDSSYSPDSIHAYCSALAKLYRVHSWEIHDEKPPRISSNFKRGRNYTVADFEKLRKKYPELMDFEIATGIRKGSLVTVSPNCFSENGDGSMTLHLDGKINNTKGGKTFDMPVMPGMEDRVREILAGKNPEKPLFPKIPWDFYAHNVRALYAEMLYAQYARPIEEIPKSERVKLKKPKKDRNLKKSTADNIVYTMRKDAPAIYRRRDGRQFDRLALKQVSVALGHGEDRVGVVALNYLWRSEAPKIEL